ncbi:MAG: bifunctional folylpolyglutamate synthase/dihydrofolate synthase, partial [Clostridiales bacterium]|nr:bifunctional folylpolyglutamate synthase/dihydrofolate synthase [Clostridiales bacterium]
MDYKQTLEYIHSIPKFNRILGNDLLRILLDMMNNPQKDLKFIHIGGTNGKGSTCTMIAEILKHAGYKVGLFTSPYLEYFNERIRINGVPISNDELVETVGYVKDISERYDAKVSEFAFDTAVAIEYFHRYKCDFVVLEVGLGGKLDATNVIESPTVIGFTAI